MKYYFAILPVAAVMLLGLACSQGQRTGASIDSAFRSGISPDAQTIVSVKLDQIKASELYKRHQDLMNLPQFDALAERAGLDPRRDVTNICIVWDGKHLMLLAQGGFNQTQLEQKLITGGAERVPFKNFTLFQHGPDAVAFPKPGLAIAGATPAAQAELDLFARHSDTVPAELQQRLSEVPGDSQIWEVSQGGLPGANFPLRSDLATDLSNIASAVSGTSFGLRFDSGSHLQARILCKSPAGAQRVNDAFRGLIGLARLSTKDNELDLLRMWDAVSISKEDQIVRVQADLPADLTDKLIAKMSSLRSHAGALVSPH